MKGTTYLIVIGFWAASNQILAQPYVPFYGGEYSGVSGVGLQPASIAGSKLEADIILAGGSLSFHGNYFNMNNGLMYSPKSSGFPRFMINNLMTVLVDKTTQSNDIMQDLHDRFHELVIPNFNENYKGGTIIGEVQLLNIMVSMSEKYSLAFGYKQRAYFNADLKSKNGFSQIERYYFNHTKAYQIDPQLNYLNAQGAWWEEFDLTYSRILIHGKRHILKGGITGKLALPKASIYLRASDVNIDVWGADNLKDANFKGTFTNGMMGRGWKNCGIGFGADFGLEYEYRPDWEESHEKMEGNIPRNMDTYLFKAGLSLLDIGFIQNLAEAYSASSVNNTYSELSSWNNLLDNIAHKNATSYRLKMPAVLTAQVDLNIGRGFYLNFIPYWAIGGKGEINEIYVHSFSSYNLTPRIEKKNWGIFLPFQYDQYKNANVGLAFRLGPFWLGSSTLLSNAVKNANNYGTDIHILIKHSIRGRTEQ